jgi:hypothetical protein
MKVQMAKLPGVAQSLVSSHDARTLDNSIDTSRPENFTLNLLRFISLIATAQKDAFTLWIRPTC